jgi:hypothetical protein
MKNLNIRLPSISVILTAVILLVFETLASPSQAKAAQTYHGTLSGGTFLCDGIPVDGPIVTGRWNVIIDPQTPAQVTLNVFYDESGDVRLARRTRCQLPRPEPLQLVDVLWAGGPRATITAARELIGSCDVPPVARRNSRLL